MVRKITLQLSEPGRGPIASAAGSSAIAFGDATAATEAQDARLPAFGIRSFGGHNRGSNKFEPATTVIRPH